MGRLKSIYKNEIEIKEISIFKAFLIMVIFTVIPVITNLISTVLLLLIDEDMSFGSIMIVGTLVVIASMILTIMMVAKLFTNKNSIINNNIEFKITKKDFICVFFIMIGYILIREALLFETLSAFDGPITDEDMNFLIENSTSIEAGVVMILLVLQALIQAPIFEELFFRGIILNGLLNRYKENHKKAILYSAIIFGVVHLNIPQGINAFIIGTILGGIYYYTGSIKLAIFAHFINNLFVFIPVPDNIIIKIAYIALGIFLIIKSIENININGKVLWK
ncbi:CPBP family intramembrane metalloprotease [Romboutsia ilealis]|uniref:CPBP family intramembrane metalloprotease n=1 Tax=Romboutsia faecis TaxID=2764597 RepID=A0ABR7JMV9_9FIRM|nr:type II CAAX endopeptidase family protein [Romboutsia faecis]MBC5996242.1 CPBP family intramembrane metalloprotease [Romboutsia faecis]MRN25115.1 CPBP family intramembrane metalloprotease [Romboutsia ilealis]